MAIWTIVTFLMFVQEGGHYLTGNFRQLLGSLTTDKGDQSTTFSGSIGFKVVSDPKGTLTIILTELNLVSRGVPTGKGDTGTLGIVQIDDDVTWFDPRTGRISLEFEGKLHYALIDRVKDSGLSRRLKAKGTFSRHTPSGLKAKITSRSPSTTGLRA